MDVASVSEYIDEVRSQLVSGHAKEHAYRPAHQRLMRGFDDVEAINDPARSAHGAPDFIFQRKSNRDIILGYAEAKDIVGIDLDKVEESEQMHRYAGYQNLYLTDYLEFRFFRDGEKYKTISIGQVVNGVLVPAPEEYQRLIDELQAFLELPPQKISSGKRLAEIMGAKTRRIRDDIISFFSESPSKNAELVKIYDLMRKMLVHDLDHSRFADMYAQTLVYGLFVARYNDTTPETFNREEARSLVPKTNPFLRRFFDHIVGPDFDERLGRAVDELCDVFRVSDVRSLVHRHLHGSKGSLDRDPIIHFYEDYLDAYDSELRRAMGAYYTPLPVARFIVRHVDGLLKREFGVRRGLADSSKIKYKVNDGQVRKFKDPKTRRTKTVVGQEMDMHRVQILDPAVGTATFLNEIIEFVYQGFKGSQQGRWPTYVNEDLVPRLNGFEFMMAPYTIAHLKLGMTLEESGVDTLTDRLHVYLTNTLEEGIKHQPDLFSFGLADAVTEESRQANIIKSDRPVLVVVGNPPYSALSSNDTTYANSLVSKYKFEPGGITKLQERKHWLHDDYLKFIAFAEDLIARNGEGIVAMITNHGYLHNKTTRGVRWHLAKTFDKIYALDLHGNVKRKEISPDGSKDENVFNIQQGVSILFAIKHKEGSDGLAEVFSADLFGTRVKKFEHLNRDAIDWEPVKLDKESVRFTQVDTTGKDVYDKGVSLRDLFIVSNSSIVTARDKLVVDYDADSLRDRIEAFADPDRTDDEVRAALFPTRRQRKYPPGDTRGWKLNNARKEVRKDDITSNIQPLAYRPFDTRYIYYTRTMVDWPRMDVMKHMTAGQNIGLVYRRQMPEGKSANYFFITDSIISDGFIKSDNKGSETLAPLYLFHEGAPRSSNMRVENVKHLLKNVDSETSHEDVLDYIYGVMHSPIYRSKFQALLKDDFPVIPVAADEDEFEVFRVAGAKLRGLHLMSDPSVEDYITSYPVVGSDTVDRYELMGNDVWINDTQYFGGVAPEVWEFEIGAYAPAQKWLEQRKRRRLSSEGLDQYQRIIKVLSETIGVMEELSEFPASWAGGADVLDGGNEE
ncbi:type ISP restriction/modification enzyme [Gordonia sp. NPDC003425]